MCNLECCKEETFKASKPTGKNMEKNYSISVFSSSPYLLTSQNTQILGSFGEQLTSFNSASCHLLSLVTPTLTRMTNLICCLQVPKYLPPPLSGLPSPTYWYGQTLNLIRRHQISLALEIFFLPPFLLCYTERNLPAPYSQLGLQVYSSLIPNTSISWDLMTQMPTY